MIKELLAIEIGTSMKVLMAFPYAAYMEVLLNTYPLQIAKRGHDVYVATSWEGDSVQSQEVRLIRINSINLRIPSLVENFPAHIGVEELIHRVNPDVVHVHNLPFITTLQYTMAARKLGVPSVVHVHGVLGRRGRLVTSAQILCLRTFGRAIFGSTSAVICLSNVDAFEVQRLGCSREKIHVIPNGVDEFLFRPIETEQKPQLLWYGRFVARANMVTFFIATAAIAYQLRSLANLV
jgi:glycosyltransferase involved in cell wall biosynthesis